MSTFVHEVGHSFDQVLSLFSHSIESGFHYFLMYPWMAIILGVVGYIFAVRAIVR